MSRFQCGRFDWQEEARLNGAERMIAQSKSGTKESSVVHDEKLATRRLVCTPDTTAGA
jgi:hypothetical protein